MKSHDGSTSTDVGTKSETFALNARTKTGPTVWVCSSVELDRAGSDAPTGGTMLKSELKTMAIAAQRLQNLILRSRLYAGRHDRNPGQPQLDTESTDRKGLKQRIKLILPHRLAKLKQASVRVELMHTTRNTETGGTYYSRSGTMRTCE